MSRNADRGRGYYPRGQPLRGRWQGRGGDQRGRGRGGYNGRGEETFPKRDIMGGLLSSPIETLEKPQIAAGEADVEISDVQYLTSYNYTKDGPPTIIVPGEKLSHDIGYAVV